MIVNQHCALLIDSNLFYPRLSNKMLSLARTSRDTWSFAAIMLRGTSVISQFSHLILKLHGELLWLGWNLGRRHSWVVMALNLRGIRSSYSYVQHFITGEGVFYFIVLCRADEFYSGRFSLRSNSLLSRILTIIARIRWPSYCGRRKVLYTRSLGSMIGIVFLGDEFEASGGEWSSSEEG